MWPANAQNAALINHTMQNVWYENVSEKHILSLLITSDSDLLKFHSAKMKHK